MAPSRMCRRHLDAAWVVFEQLLRYPISLIEIFHAEANHVAQTPDLLSQFVCKLPQRLNDNEYLESPASILRSDSADLFSHAGQPNQYRHLIDCKQDWLVSWIVWRTLVYLGQHMRKDIDE